jgi:hypothetical protein
LAVPVQFRHLPVAKTPKQSFADDNQLLSVAVGTPVQADGHEYPLSGGPVPHIDNALKHTINHAHMEKHMFVQAGAEAVDESDSTNVQPPCLTAPPLDCGIAGFGNHPQKDARCYAPR